MARELRAGLLHLPVRLVRRCGGRWRSERTDERAVLSSATSEADDGRTSAASPGLYIPAGGLRGTELAVPSSAGHRYIDWIVSWIYGSWIVSDFGSFGIDDRRDRSRDRDCIDYLLRSLFRFEKPTVYPRSRSNRTFRVGPITAMAPIRSTEPPRTRVPYFGPFNPSYRRSPRIFAILRTRTIYNHNYVPHSIPTPSPEPTMTTSQPPASWACHFSTSAYTPTPFPNATTPLLATPSSTHAVRMSLRALQLRPPSAAVDVHVGRYRCGEGIVCTMTSQLSHSTWRSSSHPLTHPCPIVLLPTYVFGSP